MAFYEFSTAAGFYCIEFTRVGLKNDWSNAWTVSHNGKELASGPDAEGALAALVKSGQVEKLRLPKRLVDWHQKGRAFEIDRPY